MQKEEKEMDRIMSACDWFVTGLILGNISLLAVILYILQAGPL